MKGIRVTVLDLETMEEGTKEITNDWLLVTAGSYNVTHAQQFENGTAIITVKRSPSTGSEKT